MNESQDIPHVSIGGLAVHHPEALDRATRGLLENTNVCVISTLGSRGQIHTRTVWVDTDGEHVVVNSVADRVWVRDLMARPSVTCTVVNLSNPYEFASIEGTVADCTRDGADDHIDFLAHKYLGVERYPFHDPSQPRLKILVRPVRILHMAPDDDALG
jgi:PPOX class probable F420-dependent enzyme